MGRGELKAKLEITAHGFSATAKKAIEELGGIAHKI
ncbi:MAG TPA: uL15m family ribosomal protein [Bacteroidales bacterium]|nr:uL15m family ribosomal protein [Bacteroidales bacterium]